MAVVEAVDDVVVVVVDVDVVMVVTVVVGFSVTIVVVVVVVVHGCCGWRWYLVDCQGRPVWGPQEKWR